MTLPGFVPRPSQDNTDEIIKIWRSVRALQKSGPKVSGMIGRAPGGSPISFSTTETQISQTTCSVRPGTIKISFQTQYGASVTGNVTWKIRYILGAGSIMDPGAAVPFGITSYVASAFDHVELFRTIDFTDYQTITIGVSAVSGGPTISLPDGTSNRELLIEAV